MPISKNGPFLRSFGFAIGGRESDVTLDEVSDDTRSLPPLSLREFLRVFVGKEHGSKTENWSRPPRGILDLDARMRRRQVGMRETVLDKKIECQSPIQELRPIREDDIGGAS